MNIRTQILTVMVATALLGAVAATSLQQVSRTERLWMLYAFKKLTHEFEKNVVRRQLVAILIRLQDCCNNTIRKCLDLFEAECS